MTIKYLCSWAVEDLKLFKTPGQCTTQRILAQAELIEEKCRTNQATKNRCGKVMNAHVETELKGWVMDM